MKWKTTTISNYYEVSNNGLVRSIDRYVDSKGGSKRLAKGKLLKQYPDKDGYFRVGINGTPVGVHKLVALTFIPNPNNLPIVHHINGNNQDNRVENLEWSTVLHNNSEPIARKRKSEGAFRRNDNKKKIRQYSIDGELIKDYNSAREIERELGFDRSSIIRVCKGKQKTSYGYKWIYIN